MRFSVITVAYNAEETIERTILSVLSQSYRDIEYILIDGCSTDKTMSIIRRYEHKISVVISEKDEGIYDAMNKGLRCVSGDYVLFLNADDYLISDHVIRGVHAAIGRIEKADIYYGAVLMYWHETGYGELKNIARVDKKMLYRTTIPHQSTLYDARVFEDLGSFDLQYPIAADFEFLVRSFKQGKVFRKVDATISIFSMGGCSTAHDSQFQLKAERKSILGRYFSKVELVYLRVRVRVKKLFGI